MKPGDTTTSSVREAAQRNRDAFTSLVVAIARALAAFREREGVRCHAGVEGKGEADSGRPIQ